MATKMPPSEDRAPDGDDDALTVPEGFHDQEPMQTEGRNRRELATTVELNPNGLSGSYFHRVEGGEVVWAGVVVGEVQPGKYLCQVDKGLDGADRVKVQVIVPIEHMLGGEYRFYDTEQDATLAGAVMMINQEVE